VITTCKRVAVPRIEAPILFVPVLLVDPYAAGAQRGNACAGTLPRRRRASRRSCCRRGRSADTRRCQPRLTRAALPRGARAALLATLDTCYSQPLRSTAIAHRLAGEEEVTVQLAAARLPREDTCRTLLHGVSYNSPYNSPFESEPRGPQTEKAPTSRSQPRCSL
jgi:hypothetical protein